MSLCFLSACGASQPKVDSEVSRFIELLVRAEEPTLAEYAELSGECGGDLELGFMLQVCRSSGWDIYADACIDLTRRRCDSADHVPSLGLRWLRSRFSTVEQVYRVTGVFPGNTEFRHELIEVRIGKHQFLLFHNTDPRTLTGLIVGVTAVNGRPISELLRAE